jgi:hypothetical protein
MEKHGIKETEEALEGVLKLGLVLWKSFHDGVQITDVADLWDKYQNDDEFKNALAEAFEGYGKIPAEVNDLSLDEVMGLTGVMVKYLPKYLNALR